MNLRPYLFLLFIYTATTTSVFGWWDTAHMLSVEIARSQLKPGVEQKVEAILSVFAEDFPESSSFVTASCFPIAPNTTPTEAYLHEGREVALRQLALPGYRLANILNGLYGEEQ